MSDIIASAHFYNDGRDIATGELETPEGLTRACNVMSQWGGQTLLALLAAHVKDTGMGKDIERTTMQWTEFQLGKHM
jgi:hypothetical protein